MRMPWTLLVTPAAIVGLALGAAPAAAQQRIEVPIPGYPLNPTSRDECQAMSREWSQISIALSQRHEVCIAGQACKNTRSNYRGPCQCSACEPIHVLRDRFSSGDLAQLRRQREQACNQSVANHEENLRRQRQAAEDARREQERAARESARQYAEAQRQYEEMQRRQREQQNAVSAQQIENQRRLMERLQAQQRQQERQAQGAGAALASLLQRDAGAGSGSATGAPATRPQSLIGGALHDASRAVDVALRAKENVKSTIDVFRAVFSGQEDVRQEARANLAERARSEAVSAASSRASALIVSMMPRRNDYEDPGFSSFFEAAQSTTTGLAPSPIGVQFIQQTAGGVLKDMLQQTLGDLNQLQRDIDSFSAGSPSYYSSGGSFRSQAPSGGQSGQSGQGASRWGFGAAGGAGAPGGADATGSARPAPGDDVAREEVESVRQGLRFAMTQGNVYSPSLARLAGLEVAPPAARCVVPGGATIAEGDSLCSDGRAQRCASGILQPAGVCR